MALALPLSSDELLMDRKLEIGGDFAKSYAGGLLGLSDAAIGRAYEPYATLMQEVADAARQRGATVVLRTRLADIGDLFERFQVVTLVAHWERRCVELRDGTHTLEAVADVIPTLCDGLADLTICECEELGLLIKRERPCMHVAITGRAVRLDLAMLLYREVLGLLADAPRQFAEVCYKLRGQLLRD